ncbi:sugar lactone lactonase YvrE [Flavobacterium sp. W4I14]|nr:sugar lactone lactonase YvrE [Flavobacterium sp. W4I14]
MKKELLIFSILIMVLSACKKGKPESRGLELVFSDDKYQLTGVAKEPSGRLWVNYPRWSDVYRYAVVTAEGTMATPYPNEAFNSWQPGQDGQNRWVCVQSVYVDNGGGLWILDPAAPMMKTIQGNGAKLVKMNKTTNLPERSYSFMNVVPDTAYVNDVRVDVSKKFAYLSESKGGGIIVVDLTSGEMRRVLSTHYSVRSDPNFKFIIDGRELMKEGKPVKINSDGIALTPDGNWIYYKPLTDDKLYRIRTEFLRDFGLSETELAAKVEDLGHFTTTDGMIFDGLGNLYLGDLQNYRIVKISPEHKMTTLIKDDRLIWPDSYSIADGYLYISCSQIQKQPEYNNGVNKRSSPYTVYRMKL